MCFPARSRKSCAEEAFISADFFSSKTEVFTQGETMETIKLLPSSFLLSTWIVPFMASTILLTMARPRPLLCTLWISFWFSCVNGSNIDFWNSSLIPMPLSRTVIVKWIWFSSVCSSFIPREIFPPSGVYFTAFERRLK